MNMNDKNKKSDAFAPFDRASSGALGLGFSGLLNHNKQPAQQTTNVNVPAQ